MFSLEHTNVSNKFKFFLFTKLVWYNFALSEIRDGSRRVQIKMCGSTSNLRIGQSACDIINLI